MNPVLALIIANLIWGAAAPIFKLALQNIPPFTLAFTRFFFAALLFIHVAFQHWQKLNRRQLIEILVGSFFAITINIGFFFLALPKTASINAPIIGSAQPIFLFLLFIFFLKEKPHKKVFYGIVMSFIGVLVIILSPLFMDGAMSVAAKESAVEGNIFLVIATFGAVMNTLIFKKVLKEINFYQITLISFVFGALNFFPLMYGELQQWSFAQLDYRGWIGIIFGVVFSSAIAYALYFYGLSKMEGQEVGIFSYIDPVIAVLLAIPLLQEYPTVYFYAGTLLVFLGIIIAEGRLQWHPFHKLGMRNSKFKI
ncbi:DMT family transporter [Candidatus Roizmanbacteria bacterium]|nr:DMT family transporter [Candidatus Roizmanbacteria bacterium]